MVAIKDFDMPSCCANCPCAKYKEVRWMEYKFEKCGITKSCAGEDMKPLWDSKSRLKDCPLVEIEEK